MSAFFPVSALAAVKLKATIPASRTIAVTTRSAMVRESLDISLPPWPSSVWAVVNVVPDTRLELWRPEIENRTTALAPSCVTATCPTNPLQPKGCKSGINGRSST